MKLKSKHLTQLEESIQLPLSKSISNRLLIMQALAKHSFKIENLSDADDTQVLIKALNSNESVIDVGMAGTAFRFLTSYYALGKQEIMLAGHARMKKRPIAELVDALRSLGANIMYLEKDSFPPLKIYGNEIQGDSVSLDSGISSQYISSLLLVAPYLKNGLQLNLKGEMVSRPYIDMTLDLMQQMGADCKWDTKSNSIQVAKGSYSSSKVISVEADWSSAAFFYQFFVCSKLKELRINGLQANSIQGDSATASFFLSLGVISNFDDEGLILTKGNIDFSVKSFDLTKEPDLIPSFSIAASYVLGEVRISGVQTLRVKESNRVEALQLELAKIGIELIDLNQSQFKLKKTQVSPHKALFEVYNDHRIAMCFAACASFINSVEIKDTDVVSKSFPNFWSELEKLCEFT